MFSVIFQRHSRSNIESVELRLFYVDPGRAAGSAGHAAGGLALLAEQRHPPQLQLILQEIMRVVLNIKLVNILITIVSVGSINCKSCSFIFILLLKHMI